MCGLVSIFSSNNNTSFNNQIVKKMLKKINHRGPDAEGVHMSSEKAILGHKRLSIIDLKNGDQPMVSNCRRYSLILNGEIYNYIELKQELIKKGIKFKTESDTEVLLNLLITEKLQSLNKINGMFAFIFYDNFDESWIVARDHFGIKPLYYSTIEEDLVFFSEIKAIFEHPKFVKIRNDEAFKEYIHFQFCLEDQTLFKNVFKIEPGNCLIGKKNKIIKKINYWNNSYNINFNKREKDFIEELDFLICDSVKLQCRSDVPIGCYLSGGLDSSLVSSLCSENIQGSLKLFHGKFSESQRYDESFFARIVSNKIKGKFLEVVPTSKDFCEELSSLIEIIDEPLAGPGVFPQYMVSKLASKHVKVVLAGQGGDEIFGGYARYLIGYLEQALKGAIFEKNEEGRHLVSLDTIIPNMSLLKEYTPLIKKFWKNNLFENMDLRYFDLIDRSNDLENIIHPDLELFSRKEEVFVKFKEIFNSPETESYINKMTYFDQKTLLPALLHIEDRVSMSVSIESRVPLLDKRIVDFVSKMPPALKFQGGKTKNILKKISKNYLPHNIIHRKDKMGFPVPLDLWMKKGSVRNFVNDLLRSKKSIERGLFNKKSISNLLENPGVGSRLLWGVISLEIWHDQNF